MATSSSLPSSSSGSSSLFTPLTFTGVSSYSNDLQTILTRAVQIAGLPLQQLQVTQADNLSQEQALSGLGSAASSLTSSLSSLGLLAAQNAQAAQTSDASVATAQLTGSVASATYTLSVTSQATAAQASTSLGFADTDTTAPKADGIYTLTVGSNTKTFNLLAAGSGRTAGATGSATPSTPDSVTVNFANGQTGSITANLKSFFVGSDPVGGASAGDTVTVNFSSDNGAINASITTDPLTGTEDATALAGLLNDQIAANADLAGKVSFTTAGGQLKLVESDTVGTGFSFSSSHTGTVTTGLDAGGAIGGESAQEIAAALNSQVAGNTALAAAGVTFSASGGQVQAAAAAGKKFTFTATDSAQGTGFVSGLAGSVQAVGYGNTLGGLRDAINTQEATLGAHAVVINTSADPLHPSYDLSIVADSTGTQTLTLLDSTNADLLPNGGTLGTNAVFSINGGATITNRSNTITNLVPGLNLTINGPTAAGKTVTISVATDRTSLQSSLQDFASNYNALVDAVNAQIGQNAGPLSGSLIVRQVTSALRSIVGYSGTGGGSIQSMAALGLEMDIHGHVSLNTQTLNSLSDVQLNDTVSFLGGTTTGFAGNAYSLLSQISDPITGSIQSEQAYFQQSDQQLADQVAQQQTRLQLIQNTLNLQLSASDTLLATLQSQQSLITGIFQSQQALAYANAGI